MWENANHLYSDIGSCWARSCVNFRLHSKRVESFESTNHFGDLWSHSTIYFKFLIQKFDLIWNVKLFWTNLLSEGSCSIKISLFLLLSFCRSPSTSQDAWCAVLWKQCCWNISHHSSRIKLSMRFLIIFLTLINRSMWDGFDLLHKQLCTAEVLRSSFSREKGNIFGPPRGTLQRLAAYLRSFSSST